MTTSKESSTEEKVAGATCTGCLGIIILIVIIGGIIAIVDSCSSGNDDLPWPDESGNALGEYQTQLIRKCIQGEKARGAITEEEEKILRQILAKRDYKDVQRLTLAIECIDLGHY